MIPKRLFDLTGNSVTEKLFKIATTTQFNTKFNNIYPTFLPLSQLSTSPLEKRFSRWKITDNNDINIFLSLKNTCTFLLAKKKTCKRIFNTNSELSQNCTEKQIMLFKTTLNCLFNGIWCYLVLVVLTEKYAFFNKQL